MPIGKGIEGKPCPLIKANAPLGDGGFRRFYLQYHGRFRFPGPAQEGFGSDTLATGVLVDGEVLTEAEFPEIPYAQESQELTIFL